MSDLRKLAEPFPASIIKKPAPGKYGDYVEHNDYVQRALSIVGPCTFGVVDLIRGHAAGIGCNAGEWKYPPRDNAVVGVVAELTATVDGKEVTITEIGTEDNPAMGHDAVNAKNALSDAYKRCWMRLGLGLHLWCDSYWLDKQLDKEEQ